MSLVPYSRSFIQPPILPLFIYSWHAPNKHWDLCIINLEQCCCKQRAALKPSVALSHHRDACCDPGCACAQSLSSCGAPLGDFTRHTRPIVVSTVKTIRWRRSNLKQIIIVRFHPWEKEESKHYVSQILIELSPYWSCLKIRKCNSKIALTTYSFTLEKKKQLMKMPIWS